MSIETKPRVPYWWAIAGGLTANVVGGASGSFEVALTGFAVVVAGSAVAAGDFVCDRVESFKKRSDQNNQVDKKDGDTGEN